ncbi:hypothetical protein LOCC1_G003349 [Lachnellula occidentalis]|uniref:P-loop containing nucleoside triphosphate hydrolase protein n=1 Tax=Lachnellula occidentalis TaxID=215460 RepID=A0A8H8S0W9_9HELO|nr:hypothetical protein LOCC1_G003349 [Lachnellula occidentalis]
MSLKMKTSTPNPTPPAFNPHLPFNQVWNLEEKVSELQISNSKPPPFRFSGKPASAPSRNIFPPTPSRTPIMKETDQEKIYERHMELLSRKNGQHDLQDAVTTPIFTMPVFNHVLANKGTGTGFAQYGLLAGLDDVLQAESASGAPTDEKRKDPRLFFNISSPSSTFICGSQGSGKSHTLSCLLENALLDSEASELPKPLAGLVFHYDSFISDKGGNPCEAAYLSSEEGVKVRVFCAPTNFRAIKATYDKIPGKNVVVEPLRISASHLDTKRMFALMALKQGDGPMPLYANTITRILGDMRMETEENGGPFVYQAFKDQVGLAGLSPDQNRPLQQRFQNLESFMPRAGKKDKANDWTAKAGTLIIVDLSCPCVTPESACSLFSICLDIFLGQETHIGRIVALDEAHKYMNASAEATTLTDNLLQTIRMQRHLGARVIISTQEPTISPALLDLSSVTIVHRFTSPQWLKTLEGHLAGAASKLLTKPENGEDTDDKSSVAQGLFNSIVNLRVGEALLFSPSAVIDLEQIGETGKKQLKRLGAAYVKIRVRARQTADGGTSVMA